MLRTARGAFYGYLLTTIAAGLTSFYSWRLSFDIFRRAALGRRASGHDHATHRAHDARGTWS